MPFEQTGWRVFAPETPTLTWTEHAARDAERALKDPALAHLYQCEGTWFVGLDALDNDALGRVAGSEPLSGAAVEFLRARVGCWPALHRAQLSVTFPGYPRPRAGENAAAFRYRRNRDAAHVDGLIGIGAPKRRFVRESHAFILGIPLNTADPAAAPLVVWEGSHLILRRAFAEAFQGLPADSLPDLDVTDVYQRARREVFETCRRVPVTAPRGGAIIIHRLALHGVAPWQEGARAGGDRRMIAYFRPEMPGGVAAWVAPDA
ncbi:hypothetical protein [uncultured Roseobacter sp.]|uniref:hypothetical protein n=1 Tax=uncultured Roseobacter sp. TaxID=114847 RepID=UPI002635CAE6|nr:hypothetical protein [uncultured Roseobacter sp.]